MNEACNSERGKNKERELRSSHSALESSLNHLAEINRGFVCQEWKSSQLQTALSLQCKWNLTLFKVNCLRQNESNGHSNEHPPQCNCHQGGGGYLFDCFGFLHPRISGVRRAESGEIDGRA